MSFVNEVVDVIKKNVDDGKRRFVICPFGNNGMIVKNVLNQQFGIDEVAIADNGLCKYNGGIIPIRRISEYDSSDIVILLTSDNAGVLEEISHYIKGYRIEKLVKSRAGDKRNKAGRYSYGPLVECYNPLIESIGSFCSFASGCTVVGNHIIDAVTTHEFLYAATNCQDLVIDRKAGWLEINKKVLIENDVWLGENVIITNGAHIGNGVIAGAGTIITKDVPDYAVVVGNPARIIRYRFSDDQIQKLNQIAWWNWPTSKIIDAYDDFFNIEVFIEKYSV